MLAARTRSARRLRATAQLVACPVAAVPGMELAARYLPGEKGSVGGDWYDVFRLPEDRLGVVIGDVVGRGLPAAMVMGRLRSALRAYAIETSDPADALERLDRKVHHFEAGQMTTILYGVLELSTGRMELSSAGHPLPVLALPGVEAVSVEGVADPPLGVLPLVTRHRIAVEIPPARRCVCSPTAWWSGGTYL